MNVLEQNPGADWSALIGEIKAVAGQEDLGDPIDDDEAANSPKSSDADDDLVSFKL